MPGCEILVTKEVGQDSAGTIILNKGKLELRPQKGYSDLLHSIVDEGHFVGGKLVRATDDVRVWFDSLPGHFNGTYLRARML